MADLLVKNVSHSVSPAVISARLRGFGTLSWSLCIRRCRDGRSRPAVPARVKSTASHPFPFQTRHPLLDPKALPLTPPGPSAQEYTAQQIRALLRRTGPLPLPKLTPQMSDEFLELTGREPGGLAGVIERYPQYLQLVRIPGPIVVALTSDERKVFVDKDACTLGYWVMALLSAAFHLPGSPQLARMRLSSPQPTVEELALALEQWVRMTPQALERFLRAYPAYFAIIMPSRRVRLLTIGAASQTPNDKRSMVGLLRRLPRDNTKEASQLQLARWLRTVVPSQYHVPLSFVLTKAAELDMTALLLGTPTPTLEQVQVAFRALPPDLLDVRAFGGSPHTVFLRVLNPEPALLETGVPDYSATVAAPELETARYNPTQLAHEVTQAVQQYAEQSSLARAAVAKGIPVGRIREFLPEALMRRIEAFYGFSATDDPSVCILLLDRFRHLWEVQLSQGTVRPWSLLPAEQQPSSLTLQTSPTPRVVQHCQRLLIDFEEQKLETLYAALPADLQAALLTVYGGPAPGTSALGANPPEKPGKAADAVRALVQTHTLFFFIQDELVHTPRLSNVGSKEIDPATLTDGKRGQLSQSLPLSPAASGKRFRQDAVYVVRSHLSRTPLTEPELVQMVYDLLPPGEIVNGESLRLLFHPSKLEAVRAKKSGMLLPALRREFFERYPSKFRVLHVLAFDKFCVARYGTPLVAPHLLTPKINSVARLIKFMALLSYNSISDCSLTRRLPSEGRQLLRAFGTATDVAEALPMFFAVQRDEANFTSSLIRYIGPLARTERTAYALKPHPSGTLTRRVPNDPFADFPNDDVVASGVDGWNDEWNEGPSPSQDDDGSWDEKDGR